MLPLMSAASLLPHSLSSRSYLSCLSFLSCVCLWCLSRVSAVGAVAAGPTRSGALQGSTLLLPTSCFLALKVPPPRHSLLLALRASSPPLPSTSPLPLFPTPFPHPPLLLARAPLLPPTLLSLTHTRTPLFVDACDFAFNGSLGFVPLYSLEAMQPNAPFSDGVLHSKKAAHVVYGKLKDRCNVVNAWN
ncbi:unnamed protein product, partial [Closterium sp. NIES-65]